METPLSTRNTRKHPVGRFIQFDLENLERLDAEARATGISRQSLINLILNQRYNGNRKKH